MAGGVSAVGWWPWRRARRPERGISSAGRAPALQAGGRRFDPVILHQRSEVVDRWVGRGRVVEGQAGVISDEWPLGGVVRTLGSGHSSMITAGAPRAGDRAGGHRGWMIGMVGAVDARRLARGSLFFNNLEEAQRRVRRRGGWRARHARVGDAGGVARAVVGSAHTRVVIA